MGKNRVLLHNFLCQHEHVLSTCKSSGFSGYWCGFSRYFQCVPTFGLFAPVSKVSRVASSSAARRGSTAGSVSRIPVGTSLILSRERSGSQESLSSLGSVTSNVSRSRLRLGVTSLAGQVSRYIGESCWAGESCWPGESLYSESCWADESLDRRVVLGR